MKVSEEFGELFRQVIGDDSYGMVSIKTQISKAYITELHSGKVPGVALIQRIADGYNLNQETTKRLYIAGGYQPPASLSLSANPLERIAEALNDVPVPDYSRRRIVDFVKEEVSRYSTGEQKEEGNDGVSR